MISSGHSSCKRLVAGNYDVLINESPTSCASLKTILVDYLNHFEHREAELGEYYKHLQSIALKQTQNDLGCNQNSHEGNAVAASSEAVVTAAVATAPTCGYIDEFKQLKELSKSLKEDKSNLYEGEHELNQRKNRYKDILPFSHTRVILKNNLGNRYTRPQQEPFQSSPLHSTCGQGLNQHMDLKTHVSNNSNKPLSGVTKKNQPDPSSSYINANYICGPSGSTRAYIACQGPLACTLDDFWRMIWECNVSVIVMACNENESGKPKCELYWPDQINGSQVYRDVKVTLMRVRQINSDFLIRKFSIKLLEPEALQMQYAPSPSQQQQSQHALHQSSHESQQNFGSGPQHQQPGYNYAESINNNNSCGSNLVNCSHANGLIGEETPYYDCDSNSFKLAGVRLATLAVPMGPLHRQQSYVRDQYLDNRLADDKLTQHYNRGSGTRCISHDNSSASSESLSTSDDSNSMKITTTAIEKNGSHTKLRLQQQQPLANRRVITERTVCQFHYTTWPDHGVPDSVHPILELVRLIREVQPTETKPILVHCSAGCGRTGTICCIDYVWGLLRLGRLEADFNLFNIIRDMRRQRMAMVQTLEQYILCHRAVAALFVQQLQLFALEIGAQRYLSASPSLALINHDQSSSSIEDESKSTNDSRQDNGIDKAHNREDDENVGDGNEDDDEAIDNNQDENELGPVFI